MPWQKKHKFDSELRFEVNVHLKTKAFQIKSNQIKSTPIPNEVNKSSDIRFGFFDENYFSVERMQTSKNNRFIHMNP